MENPHLPNDFIDRLSTEANSRLFRGEPAPKESGSMRLYFDLEFTGLHQHTTPLSLGIVSEHGHTFYAEFVDYAEDQVDAWLRENVLAHMRYQGRRNIFEYRRTDHELVVVSSKVSVADDLRRWVAQWNRVQFWGDCLAYDWVLLCELFGGARNLPSNVSYIPMDLCTLLEVHNIDPDISREQFAGIAPSHKHNALHDAQVIRACHRKLLRG